MEMTREGLMELEQRIDDKFDAIHKKLDQILDPEKGVHAKIIKYEMRLNNLESFQKTVMAIVWKVLTPIFSILGLGLIVFLYYAMQKVG